MRSNFLKGMYHGLPIALGYFSVSFGFGIMAVKAGLSVLAAVGISVTNLTSAGQAAGVAVIASSGTLIEMVFTQLVINLRYSLMALSLSQKLDGSFNTFQRMLVAFGITDEVFAVASVQDEKLSAKYMRGLILTPIIGWTLGTFIGAAAGQLLPTSVSSAMGIMLYGMFIAIVVPPAKKNHRIAVTAAIAVILSVIIYYFIPVVSSGFAVIISAVISAVISALLFPVDEESKV